MERKEKIINIYKHENRERNEGPREMADIWVNISNTIKIVFIENNDSNNTKSKSGKWS